MPAGNPPSADQTTKGCREIGFAHRAEGNLAVTVGGLEHPGGLARHPEPREDRPVGVAHVLEGQTVSIDEFVDLVLRAVPTDADDTNLSGPLFACRLDRGGFSVAGASIRCPEPKGDGLADEA